ncbi:MAG: hypothetical protein QXU20_04530 [Candidatus Woesearchaeota archaeon]
MRFKIKKQGKKAQLVMEGLVDVIAILFTFLTAVIFFLVFKIEGCGGDENKIITNSTGILRANNALLNYLRTPVVMNGNNLNMSDLIMMFARDTNNKEYKESLLRETNNFLEFYIDCAYININGIKKNLLSVRNSACQNLYEYEYSCSSITLPSKKDDEKVKVESCISISAKPLDVSGGP